MKLIYKSINVCKECPFYRYVPSNKKYIEHFVCQNLASYETFSYFVIGLPSETIKDNCPLQDEDNIQEDK